MLLTAGQVSLALSGGIVLICSFALFISGYILQQQTVRSLQTIINTRRPQPQPHPQPLAQAQKPVVAAAAYGDPEPGGFSTGVYDEEWYEQMMKAGLRDVVREERDGSSHDGGAGSGLKEGVVGS